MVKPEDRAEQLQRLLEETIPLANAMQARVRELGMNEICIEAPVNNTNSNIHNTGFAGSIYSVAALAAWGLVHMRLLAEEIGAEVVLANAEISYRLPVKETIRARGQVEEKNVEKFLKTLLHRGRARLAVVVEVNEGKKPQAILDASLAVKIST